MPGQIHTTRCWGQSDCWRDAVKDDVAPCMAKPLTTHQRGGLAAANSHVPRFQDRTSAKTQDCRGHSDFQVGATQTVEAESPSLGVGSGFMMKPPSLKHFYTQCIVDLMVPPSNQATQLRCTNRAHPGKDLGRLEPSLDAGTSTLIPDPLVLNPKRWIPQSSLDAPSGPIWASMPASPGMRAATRQKMPSAVPCTSVLGR